MIWLLPVIIFVVMSGFTIRYKLKHDVWFDGLIIPTILLTLFSAPIFAVIGLARPEKQIENAVFEIVQMRQDTHSNISGSGSFLGWSFNGSEKAKYIIMQKYNNGIMKRIFLNQDETYVVEVETNEQPRVEYKQTKTIFSKWIHFPTLWNKQQTQYYHSDAIIFVPKGTVATQFDEL